MKPFSRLVLGLALTSLLLAAPASAQSRRAGIGVMGDSYSDEYRFYPPDRARARNWVEILSATRGVNFGALSQRSRGEPRNRGFAYDWARENATSDDLIAAGQHTGLAAQVRRGEVRFVVLFIGGNDFLIKVGRSPDPLAELQTVVPEALANVTTALQTILSASPDVRVVVVTIPNIALLPAARLVELDPRGRALLQAAGTAIDAYNAQLRAIAEADPRIALADLAALTAALGSLPVPLTIGGVPIDVVTPSNEIDHLFLADGIHIGTVAQGLLANLIATTLNDNFGTRIRPLSEREIIQFAARTFRATRPSGR